MRLEMFVCVNLDQTFTTSSCCLPTSFLQSQPEVILRVISHLCIFACPLIIFNLRGRQRQEVILRVISHRCSVHASIVYILHLVAHLRH